MTSSWKNRIAPLIGLGGILLYAWSIHPIGFSKGYAEDLCPDIRRQAMAENLSTYGKPTFHSDSYMAPYGVSMPYMSWTIEEDWLGAYFWKWNPHFPFNWAYVCLSFLICYLGAGWIFVKMGLDSWSAWGLATAAVFFNVPRHFKTWHHFDHLPQHWIYLSFFLDAWIWHRFWRDRKFSLSLEFWRGLLLLGLLCGTGYFWGPMILEWLLVRGTLLALWRQRIRQGIQTQFEIYPWRLLLPSILGTVLLAFEIKWYLPLYQEVHTLKETVANNLGWFAYFYDPFRPLWLDWIVVLRNRFFENSETVSSIGWFWMVPFFLSIHFLKKKNKGPGLGAILPFLIFIVFAYAWESKIMTPWLIDVWRKILPFMDFFRVASRWSLLLPAAMASLIAIAWMELRERFLNWVRTHPQSRLWLGIFALSSVLEGSYLFYPVNMLPEIPPQMVRLLNRIGESPGTTVLDLPFCVTGGNHCCGEEQCPNYPASTVGMCLRLWHGKKIYGLYQSRMVSSHCEIYNRSPYVHWFSAWREHRCFNDLEWAEFCLYLNQHPELSAILLYPEVWFGAKTAECQTAWDHHLGHSLDEAIVPISPTRGGQGADPTRILLYNPRCTR